MRTDPLLALAGSAIAALGVVVGLVPTAHAADPELLLSRDGRTWTSSLSGPLLDEDTRLVPGGSVRSPVWVRNASGLPTTLTVLGRGASTTVSPSIPPQEDFRVRVDDTTVTGSQLAQGCRVLASRSLQPGDEQRIPVVVALPHTAGSLLEDQSLTASFEVRLVAGEAPSTCAGQGQSGAGAGQPGSPPRGEAPDAGSGTGDASTPASGATPRTPVQVATDGGRWAEAVGPRAVAPVLLLAAVAATVLARRWATGHGLLSGRGRGPRGRRAS